MNSKFPPLISIIVAVFNGEKTIQQCIDSVAQQSYPYKELIIIDGGSTDRTVELIKANQDKVKYWISEPDGGIYHAWNKGLAQVSGEWVAFLGVDDIYLPTALQDYVDYLLEHQSIQLDYISSKVNLVNDNKLIRTIGKPWSWNAFRRYMNVAHVGSLHHKSLFIKYGLYDTTYKICADYELLLRARGNLRAGFLNKTTVNMSVGGASDNHKALYETKQAKMKSGGRNSIICSIENIFGLFKFRLRKRFWY